MNQAMEVSAYSEDNQAGLSSLNDQTTEEEGAELLESNAGPADNQDSQEQNADDQQTKDDENKSEIEVPKTQEEAGKVLNEKGLDMGEFENEFMSNGELSKESYDKLSKAGIPPTVVDAYIAGQQALVESFVGEVQALAGGPDQYKEMTDWARAHLSKEECAAYDHLMTSTNREAIKLAVTGMVSKWKAEVGSAPKLVQSRATSTRQSTANRVQGFKSVAEMTKAMQDKRYGTDAGYTRSVEEKVMRSNIFG